MARDIFQFSRDAMDLLFPLHVTLDGNGRIDGFGPTTERIFGDDISTRYFFDIFKVEKPRRITDYDSLLARIGTKLVLNANPDNGETIQFRSVATPLSDSDRLLLDLSLGISLADAIKRYDLTGAHFRPNDFSIDLFYTFETQRSLLDDSQKMARALTSAKEDAERKAYLDPVTGIANRRALYRRLEDILDGQRDAKKNILLHIDLDKFKMVNDAFGHAAGDKILQHTAKVLQAFSGPSDMPARIGGDEFALLLTDAPDDVSVMQLGTELVNDISRPVKIDGHSCKVGASVGIVRFGPGHVIGSDRLLMQSDIALYNAKGTDSPVQMLTPGMLSEHNHRTTLIAEIERAIEERQFIPYFQPQVDIRNGTIYGLEVLARWDSPTQGLLSPADFLETAIRANLMSDIDRSVRQQAMAAFSNWRHDGADAFKLSLNVTASNLRSPDFVEELQDELLMTGLSPALVQIELLESILFDQSDQLLVDQCYALRQAGFTLALDDFGTGHASISTLIDAPVSMLKIDRSLVSGLKDNTKKQSIARSVLAMAHHIGLDVLAEGVETYEDLKILRAGGCQYFQGYHFCPPQPQDSIPAWRNTWYARKTAPYAGQSVSRHT